MLGLLFLLSGASALLFESLWFRQAGLVVGNSVWTSSLVLACFMGGLALGNAWAARHGGRLRRPLRFYAGLELTIGLTGILLVLLLPHLGSWLVPLFRRLLDRPLALDAVRLAVVSALLLVPCTAMGATFPVMVRVAAQGRAEFGRVLGRLYGWNTFGAMAGALLGEAVLVERLGVRGTAATAATLNVVVALLALLLSRRPDPGALATPVPVARTAPGSRLLLLAAFLSGGLLLALEVVWFRFLLLFVSGTKVAFAVMLAVVLGGIAAGGWIAAAWLRARPRAHRLLPPIALVSSFLTAGLYAGFDRVLALVPSAWAVRLTDVVVLSGGLMLPVCVLSGVIFTLLGRALKEDRGGEAETAGALTLANTCGGLLGAPLAGFGLLPRLGIERSLFLIAVLYGGVALATALDRSVSRARSRAEGWALAAGVLLFGAGVVLFPFGLMTGRYLPIVVERFADDGSRVVAVREGVMETAIYLRAEAWGEPVSHRLLSNGFSMSGTAVFPRRYMNLFAYWPLALHPAPRQALLISYGVGSTAQALADASWLTSIDVVDPSREILEMSRIAHPAKNPLDDPRVRVHLEDGRFFLQTTPRRFDLITGEPPPPKNADIVNLYTREYFHLMRERLAEGGVATYWLPVPDMFERDSKAVIRAFCEAFDDCSLWTGAEWDWMLVGTRGLAGSRTEAEFSRPWRDAALAPDLRAVGFEAPEQLGATFIADAPFLRDLTRDVPPLVDDWPYRLSVEGPPQVEALHATLLDPEAARSRFESSALVGRLWPEEVRRRTLGMFGMQGILNATYAPDHGRDPMRVLSDLGAALRHPDPPLATLPLWILGSHADEQHAALRALARGVNDPGLFFKLGMGALAARQYRAADQWLARSQAVAPRAPEPAYWRAVARLLVGDREEARDLLPPPAPGAPPVPGGPDRVEAMERALGLSPPAAARP